MCGGGISDRAGAGVPEYGVVAYTRKYRIPGGTSASRRSIGMAQIVVLTHEYDHFPGRSYLLRTLFRSWGRSGHSIAIVRGMPDDARADVAIQHVDCSVVPPDYFAFAGRFPVVING